MINNMAIKDNLLHTLKRLELSLMERPETGTSKGGIN
jgi:hypothetical protein